MFVKYLKALCCFVGAAYGFCFLYVAFARVDFPYLIEWMEGGSLQQASYFLSKLKVYPEPSLDHLPYIYTPLYVYVSALLIKFFPATLTTLRIASIATTLLASFMIFLIVRRVTNAKTGAFIGAMLYLAAFEFTGCFMDIARVDSLQVALMVSALYAHLRCERGAKTWVVFAAGLYTLGFLCKQPSLIFFLVVAGGLAARSVYLKAIKSPDVQVFVLTSVFVTISLSLLATLEPWAFWYIFDIPSGHELTRIGGFFFDDLLKGMWVFMALAASCFFYKKDARDWYNLQVLFLQGAACLLVGMLPRMKVGGYSNNLMPIVAGFSILAGAALGHADAKLKFRRNLILPLVCGLYLVQFFNFFYRPHLQIPSADNMAQAKAFTERLRSIDGEVFSVYEGYLNVVYGRGHGQFHWMPFIDISWSYPETSAGIREDLRAALVARTFSAVLYENGCFDTMQKELLDNYVLAPEQGWTNRLRVLTGGYATPGSLWLRKQ